jgi:hypothetical protein
LIEIQKDLKDTDIIFFLFPFQELNDTKIWETIQKLNEFQGKVIVIHNKIYLEELNMEKELKEFKSEIIQMDATLNDPEDSKRIVDTLVEMTKNMSRKRVLKIAMLGPGEVGKTTIFKRLHVMKSSKSFSIGRYNLAKAAVPNIIHGLKVLFSILIHSGKWIPKDPLFVHYFIHTADNSFSRVGDIDFDSDLKNYQQQINDLKKDEMFQDALLHHHKYQLNDGFPYLVDHLDDVLNISNASESEIEKIVMR